MTNRLWQPSTTLYQRKQRANVYKIIRDFFAARGVLEITTPLLASCAAWEIHLDSIATQQTTADTRKTYLQTSPEQHMKRLLCAGSGDIYQICQAFRAHEQGEHHNHEFTLVEWYRLQQSFESMIAECCELITMCVAQQSIHFTRRTYEALFMQYIGVHPHQLYIHAHSSIDQHTSTQAHIATLQKIIQNKENGSLPDNITKQITNNLDVDALLDYTFARFIQPQLVQPTLVTEFPATSAAMAKIDTNKQGFRYAKRVELYWKGLEILNGYDELTDANELAERYTHNTKLRQELHKPFMPYPKLLFDAMHHGLPACCGVALGIDRLLMCITKATHITQVINFPYHNA